MTPGCHSIDMSKDKTRCYLNSETECNVHVQEDTTVPDKEYMLLVRTCSAAESRRRFVTLSTSPCNGDSIITLASLFELSRCSHSCASRYENDERHDL